MKKILFFFAICCISQQAMGQFWIDVSAKAGWGPNFLINSNLINDDELTHKANSFGHFFAGKLGLNFGDEHSLNFDFATTRFNQKFKDSASTEYDESPEFYSFDIALLYRKLSLGRYLEIGPVYNRIDDGGIGQELLNPNNFGAIFGFGRTLAGGDRFALNLGLRFRYIFTDVVNESAINTLLAATEPAPYWRLPTSSYETYKPFTPLSAFVILELDWAVGVFGTSTCYRGRQRLILF